MLICCPFGIGDGFQVYGLWQLFAPPTQWLKHLRFFELPMAGHGRTSHHTYNQSLSRNVVSPLQSGDKQINIYLIYHLAKCHNLYGYLSTSPIHYFECKEYMAFMSVRILSGNWIYFIQKKNEMPFSSRAVVVVVVVVVDIVEWSRHTLMLYIYILLRFRADLKLKRDDLAFPIQPEWNWYLKNNYRKIDYWITRSEVHGAV